MNIDRDCAERKAAGLAFIPGNWQALLLVAIFLGVLPYWLGNDYLLLVFNVMALNAMVVLGLNLLIGSTGQVSLGHAAFYGLGAYLSAIASTTWHWPLPFALAFAVVLVAATSFLLALPTLRLEGHYLVMATLGFNIIVSILLGQFEPITGGPSGFPGIPKLRLGSLILGSDRAFYYFIWGLFVVMFALSLNLLDSRVGRALQAIHDKELTAQALGIPSHRYKVMTFVMSALYAAIAGFCYAHYVTFISPKTFDIFYSVQVVTMVVVGGMGSIWGGLAGTALLTYLPELLHRFEDLHILLYGLILMGVLVFCPQGLLPAILSLRIFKKKAPSAPPQYSPGGVSLGKPPTNPIDPLMDDASSPGGSLNPWRIASDKAPLLSLQSVSLSFGGLQALHDVSIEVYPGEIVALIGPNGAGKTTLLNVISGILKPNSGDVLLNGRSFLKLAPHQIAVQGIGRTFQAVQIYPKFSLIENILLGYHTQGSAGFTRACLHAPGERDEERTLRKRALGLLESFNLAQKADSPVQQLSLIEQKLLEMGRALALPPSVLLLDEPVGGLNPRESEILVDYVSHLRRRGLGIILVEHDMNVVMRLADRIVVLQHGRLIASGSPREIQQNARVIEAYLGVRKAGGKQC